MDSFISGIIFAIWMMKSSKSSRYLLNELVTVNGGSQAFRENIEHTPFLFRELLALMHILPCDVGSDLLWEEGDVVRNDDRPEGAPGVALLLVRQTSTIFKQY